jgi:hypothetical protein
VVRPAGTRGVFDDSKGSYEEVMSR